MTRLFKWMIGSLILAGGVSCESVDEPDIVLPLPNTNARQPAVSGEHLRVGDKIEIFVMEDKSFNGIYDVRERGDLILPKVGRVVVAGLTTTGAERKIQNTLEGEGDQLTTATVIADRVARAGGNQPGDGGIDRVLVFLTGRVARPGQHKIPVVGGGSVGAFEAITIAGGIDRFGDERKVHILRKSSSGNRVRIPVDLRKVRLGQTADPEVGNGDIIVIPEARFLPL